jgi:hypothetical protein
MFFQGSFLKYESCVKVTKGKDKEYNFLSMHKGSWPKE